MVKGPSHTPNANIDWSLPDGAADSVDDWLVGPGATAAENALLWAAAVPGLASLAYRASFSPIVGWRWWHYAFAAAMVLDVAGGAVANSLSTCKRLYHGPVPASATRLGRFLHNTMGFTALHVHPIVVAALYPGRHLLWGSALYSYSLAGAAAVHYSPLYLARPLAMLFLVTAMSLQEYLPAPGGWAWFAPIFLSKLVLAHAVREEPYRPDN
ncbi:hypothetical protein DFJ74DRAFT_705902 [Hyaloraphidium curvatum]|nr:hypothetical protein DFJ74DRAFT_705902 [Hyaloraphidium curvatum]